MFCTSKTKISFTHTHPNPTVQEPVLPVVESHPVENSCSWFSKQTQGSLDVQLTRWLQICKQPGKLEAVSSVVKISLENIYGHKRKIVQDFEGVIKQALSGLPEAGLVMSYCL